MTFFFFNFQIINSISDKIQKYCHLSMLEVFIHPSCATKFTDTLESLSGINGQRNLKRKAPSVRAVGLVFGDVHKNLQKKRAIQILEFRLHESNYSIELFFRDDLILHDLIHLFQHDFTDFRSPIIGIKSCNVTLEGKISTCVVVFSAELVVLWMADDQTDWQIHASWTVTQVHILLCFFVLEISEK